MEQYFSLYFIGPKRFEEKTSREPGFTFWKLLYNCLEIHVIKGKLFREQKTISFANRKNGSELDKWTGEIAERGANFCCPSDDAGAIF